MPDSWTEAIRHSYEALQGEGVLRWKDREVRLVAAQGKRTKGWLAYGDRLIAEWGKHAASATKAFEPTLLAKLRADQRVSLWEWGGDLSDDGHVVRHVVERFAEAMRSASKAYARKDYDANRLPSLIQDPLERLLRDVLNEQTYHARCASHAEDFLEKTDLRVRYPDLDRPRGARVQVAWAMNAAALEEKKAGLKLRDEYVFVTPFTMAQACEVDVTEFTRQLTYALRHPLRSERGPAELLPTEWKAAIRETVHRDAVETTARLRARQA